MILFANTFVFCDIIYKLCKIRAQKVKVGVDKKDYSRTEIMERLVLDRFLCIRHNHNYHIILHFFFQLILLYNNRCFTYVKLFLGMGIMWVFEIISGITSDVHESTWLVFNISYDNELKLDFLSY